MAAAFSADVDYLETVYPLDYSVFQSIISNQFAKRRMLPTPRETLTPPNSPAKKQSELASNVPGNKLPCDEKSPSSASADDGFSESGMILDRSSKAALDSESSMELADPPPSDLTSCANQSADGRENQTETTEEILATDDVPVLTRTPASTYMVAPVYTKKRWPRDKEKTVKFAEFRRALNPYRAICGTFHQASHKKGLSDFKGSQCTSIALTAIMVSKSLPVHTWIPADIDAILRSGDSLHEAIMNSLGRLPEEGKLELNEIKSDNTVAYSIPAPNPHNEDWFNNNLVKLTMTLRRSLESRGKVMSRSACSKPSETGVISMEDVITHIFDDGFDGAIIKVGTTTGAVVRDLRRRIRYFDPHSNSKLGRPIRHGTAVLLRFPSVRQFTQYIKRREKNPLCRFHILGVSFRVRGRFIVGHSMDSIE